MDLTLLEASRLVLDSSQWRNAILTTHCGLPAWGDYVIVAKA